MTALLDHYPILSRVPAEQRAALVTQAEAGMPLDETQAAALGYPALAGCVLVPRFGAISQSVLDTIFEDRAPVLRQMTQAALRDMEKSS